MRCKICNNLLTKDEKIMGHCNNCEEPIDDDLKEKEMKNETS